MKRTWFPAFSASLPWDRLPCVDRRKWPSGPVVLADILMPQMDGLTLLEHIKSRDPAITVIIMTAYGTIEKAVEAMA
jgi:DNA-binding NtrC family response regulator